MGNKSSLLLDRHEGLSGERRDRSWSFTGNMGSPTLSGLKGSRHRTMSLSQHPGQSRGQDRHASISNFRIPGTVNKSSPQEIRSAGVGPQVFSSSMTNVSQIGKPHSWAVDSKEFSYRSESWRIPHIHVQESTDTNLSQQNMANWSGRYSVTKRMELQNEKRVSINKRSNISGEKNKPMYIHREFPTHLKDDMDLESSDDFFNEGFRPRTNSTSIIEIGRKDRSRVVMGAASANLRRKQQFTPVTRGKYNQDMCMVMQTVGTHAGDYVELDPNQGMSHEQQNLNNEQLYLRGEVMGKGLKEKVAADEVILPPFKDSPNKMTPKTWKGKKLLLPDIHEEKILSSSVPNCSAEFLLQNKAERQLLPSFLHSPNMDKYEADFLRKRSHSISNASGYVSHQQMSWNLPQGISGADNREILIHYSPFCVRKFAKKSSESTMLALKPKAPPQSKERSWNYNMSLGDSCSNLLDVSSDGKGSGIYHGQNKNGKVKVFSPFYFLIILERFCMLFRFA